MGTRADFYIKNDDGMEWLGSIAWDGYPDGIDGRVLEATDEAEYRAAVSEFFASRDDVTLPERGWPWPWDTSDTTDFGYVLIPGDAVYFACFGRGWIKAPDYALEDEHGNLIPADGIEMKYPDMSARKNVRFDRGSGVMFFGG